MADIPRPLRNRRAWPVGCAARLAEARGGRAVALSSSIGQWRAAGQHTMTGWGQAISLGQVQGRAQGPAWTAAAGNYQARALGVTAGAQRPARRV